MIEVPLVGRHGSGKVALIDDEDADRVLQYRWSLHPAKGYAVSALGRSWKHGQVYLHRFVLNAKPGDPQVDHWDKDRLNCQKANLRSATVSQNNRNCALYRSNTSGLKGVYQSRKTGRWIAQISVNGKTKHLGSFTRKEDAGRAYADAVLAIAGPFATDQFGQPVR